MTSTKVFGIGLSRTGTQSLAAALKILGYRTVHFPEDDDTFFQLRSGDFRLRVLDHVDALCDTPIVPYYAQLDHAYPNSRFVLTVRSDQASWLASVERLWEQHTGKDESTFNRFVSTAVYGIWAFSAERFSYVYDTHVRNVRSYFYGRPRKLLEIDICAGDGWNLLAPFLGVAPPATPFPDEDFLR